MEKRWNNAELTDLKRRASNHTTEELALRFRTDAAQVRDKLAELGIEAASPVSEVDKAAIADFDRAVHRLHEQKWSEAIDLFEKVIAETEGMQLADRARQHLEICRQRIEPANEDPDPYLQAVFEKNRGNLEEALALCRANGAADDDAHYAYLMASIQALSGAEDEALELLETAIRLDAKNRVHAFHDPDFKALRGREEFSQLIQAP